MKKLLLMLCFIAGITSMSKAQGGRPRMSPEERAKQMQTQLKLSDDQTGKITSIYQAQSTKMDSVRTASNGDRQAMMQAMRPMMEESNKKVMAILTPDQQKAYTKMMEDMRARMQNGGGGAPPQK